MFLVFVSIASIFIGTMPSCRVQSSVIFKRRTELQPQTIRAIHLNWTNRNNATIWSQRPTASASQFIQETAQTNQKIENLLTTQPHDALIIIDIVCMLFFTAEFVIRFVVCPRKLRLLKSMSTVFDLLYLLPVWLLFFIDVTDGTFWDYPERITFLLLIQAFMVMRVFRIFRLMRHYRGLKILWLAVRASVGELFLLYVFVFFCITIFASFIYCAEIFNNDGYENILVGLWWALITMTTVGYGDMYPSTWAGYVVASICALTGIIIIGMPVPIIASNFHAYYGMQVPGEDDVVVKKNKVVPVDVIAKPEVVNNKPVPVDVFTKINKNGASAKEGGISTSNEKDAGKKDLNSGTEDTTGPSLPSDKNETTTSDSRGLTHSNLPPPLFGKAAIPSSKPQKGLKPVDKRSANRAGVPMKTIKSDDGFANEKVETIPSVSVSTAECNVAGEWKIIGRLCVWFIAI